MFLRNILGFRIRDQDGLGFNIKVRLLILVGTILPHHLQLGGKYGCCIGYYSKMTSLFRWKIMPISEAAQDWSQKKFKDRKLNLSGLRCSGVVGNQDVITNCINFIPLTIGTGIYSTAGIVKFTFADLAIIPLELH